jgi:superfamily II DNA or RNA helicase
MEEGEVAEDLDNIDFRSDSDCSLRSYQKEILETAKLENIIAVLPTGSGNYFFVKFNCMGEATLTTGKTLIAAHLINDIFDNERDRSYCVAFIAHTKVQICLFLYDDDKFSYIIRC